MRAIRSSASLRSSGGSASALSSMTSTAVPPRPNTTTGPKVGSSARPAISSRAFGPAHHRLDGDAGDARVGLQPLGALEDVGGRLAHRLLAGEVELTPPTSDLCTISGERILTATVPPSARIGRAAAAASSAVAARVDGRDRDVVGARAGALTSSGSSQRAALAAAPRRRSGARVAASGAKSCGRLSGVSIKLILRLAVAHEMHEAAHRVGLGGEMRNAAALEDACVETASSPIQTAKTGLLPHSPSAGRA